MQSSIPMTIRIPCQLAEKIIELSEQNHSSFNTTILSVLFRDPELLPPGFSQAGSQFPDSLIADFYKPRSRSHRVKGQGGGC